MPVRILVLDGEAMIAKTLEVILRVNGYDAHGFTTSEEALTYARDHRPNVAILAVVPKAVDLDGASVGVELAKADPSCHVLLVSATPAASKFVSKAIQQGFNFELIPKPILPTDLLEKINQLTADLRSGKRDCG